MTATEFSFLALGLMLGLVSGAALVELVRARPPVPREVRLTVSHDAIPRRSSTLANDAYTAVGPEPARGGPADRRLIGDPYTPGVSERRTSVQYGSSGPLVHRPSMAGAIPVAARILEPVLPHAQPPDARRSAPGDQMVGISISSGDDPVLDRLRRGGAVAAPTAVALLDRPRSKDSATDPADTERCAEERRLVEERCELATRARARAVEAADALRVAQRAYDGHEATAVTAAWRADPRAIHQAKDAAQGGFRGAVAGATDPDQLEAAARDWLTEINRINTEAREATATAAREHAAAAEIGASLERLGLEADAARIAAENADATCLAARVAVADCDEHVVADPSNSPVPTEPRDLGEPHLDDDETLGVALESGEAPRIFRLLRGDRQAMTSLVASLAGEDPDARRRWQLQLTGLVEAIVADAIEDSALEFPVDHVFWGVYTMAQGRDIARALSSLGYRFDGLGGWTDGRYPSQRDLSLALGYAGLDPKRIRHWPTEEDVLGLFQDVSVAADEYLAGVAGDLTLAEMVTMLGRRADGLAEIWNQWGRIRPLLLDEA